MCVHMSTYNEWRGKASNKGELPLVRTAESTVLASHLRNDISIERTNESVKSRPKWRCDGFFYSK